MTTNGKAIAMTVAGLLLAVAPLAHADDKAKDKDAKVHCGGVNACKGKGSCAGASNSCSGQNGCKGKGWVEKTAQECKDAKGKVVADKPADSKKK